MKMNPKVIKYFKISFKRLKLLLLGTVVFKEARIDEKESKPILTDWMGLY
jgi:hypothetical protein